jgi:hypothetical protein
VITGDHARKIQAGTYVENQKVEKHSVFDRRTDCKGNRRISL